MSLRGRKFFDVLQHHPSSPLNSSRFRLPCPPYQNPEYWDRLYKDMTSDEVFEWGNFDLQDGLHEFRYEKLLLPGDDANNQNEQQQQGDDDNVQTSTFAECMEISQLSTPDEASDKYEEQQAKKENNESILLLGCGNSKFGEQLLMNSFVGPVLQIDMCSKVMQLMTQRYQKYLTEAASKRMEFIVDDAQGLTALSPDSVGGGVLDKGLIDVLHCSAGMLSADNGGYMGASHDDDKDPIRQIVDSVHRVLQPSRPFVFFSRSGPEYILRRTLGTVHLDSKRGALRRKWKEIQVLKLVDLDVLLYRFVKADNIVTRSSTDITRGSKHKTRRRK